MVSYQSVNGTRDGLVLTIILLVSRFAGVLRNLCHGVNPGDPFQCQIRAAEFCQFREVKNGEAKRKENSQKITARPSRNQIMVERRGAW
jgi:hypothetical protein